MLLLVFKVALLLLAGVIGLVLAGAQGLTRGELIMFAGLEQWGAIVLARLPH